MQSVLRLTYQHWLKISILFFIIIGSLSLIPLPQLPPAPGSDKLHHLIAYTALAFPVALRKPKFCWLILLCYFSYSGLIELVQPYVNRYGEWLDMLANCSGIIIGVLLAKLLRHYFPITFKASEK